MRIRKITEGTIVDGDMKFEESYQLLLDEKEQGFDMEFHELIDLHRLLGKVVAPNNQGYYVPEEAKLLSSEPDDDAKHCPDYIEPPEIINPAPAIKTKGRMPKEAKANEPVTVKEKVMDAKSDAAKQKPLFQIERDVKEVIRHLPVYKTPLEFKDKCANDDIGRGKYSVEELKEYYLVTHSKVRW